MGKLVGNCQETCPVVAVLEGRNGSYEQASVLDAIVAEELSNTPYASQVLMEGCPLGAPRHQRFSFAKLACSSEVIKEYTQPPYLDSVADSPALTTP